MNRLAGLPILLVLVALAGWTTLTNRNGPHTPRVEQVAAAVDSASPTVAPALQTVTPTPPITLLTANTPRPTASQQPTDTPTQQPVPTSPYTVQPGDTLASLASRLSIPADNRDAWIIDVLAVNSLNDANHVEAGQTLVLPSLDEALTATKADTPTPTATQSPTGTPDAAAAGAGDTTPDDTSGPNATPAPEDTADPTATATPDGVSRLEPDTVAESYVVQLGDTLSTIADSLGIASSSRDAWMAKVLQLNNIADVDHVEVGETLTLPDVDPASESTTASKETVKQTVARYTAADASVLSGAAAPTITGTSAAILDGDCGSLVYGLDAHERLAPASLTKIITAIVTMQHAGLNDQVTADVSASEMAEKDYSVMGLEPGMTVSVKDLLYGLLLPSGNDAAQTLATYVGGGTSGFVGLMNQEAAQLGLDDTHFTNPSGLDDPGLYSSAYDMAEAGLVLLANPTLARIVDTISYMPDSADWTNGALTNDNQMLATYPGAYGLKIGYDDAAGETIVAAAEQNGRDLVASVFGSNNRYADASSLLDWAFANLPATCAG